MTDAERDAERRRHEAARAPMRRILERDRDINLRVLVLAEAFPLTEVAGFRMVSALANRASDIRVTVGVARADDAVVRALEAKGVEVVVDADPAWIADRPMHATVVVILGAEAALRYGELVLDRQPQAALVYDPSGPSPGDHLAGRRAEAPLIAAADVVLAPGRGFDAFVRALSPSALVVLSAPGTPDLDRALALALATCGVAVPDSALPDPALPDVAPA
ncbi:MAG TPA: hypothetical protein VLA82_05815 [Actinomycetota bacterium]|nr:hypothetical protein [Actinomycetota bacterium]